MLLVHLINRVVREKEQLIGRQDEGWRDEGMEVWGGVGAREPEEGRLRSSLLWLF